MYAVEIGSAGTIYDLFSHLSNITIITAAI
jgi:hypothetical protein